MEFFLDVLIETCIDSLKIFPFLFLTYLLMEYLEHHTGSKVVKFVEKAGPFGPAVGALAGLVPQCGFSTAATGLYAGRIVSLGTLLAVYLSTSDEMIPVLISNQVPGKVIVSILAVKLITGMAAGFVIDGICRLTNKGKKQEYHIHEMCESEHCHCEDGIFKSALRHSLKVLLFVFIISLIITYLMKRIGVEGIQYVTIGESYGVIVLASIIGLIPNCAVSVALTELYAWGMLGEGALISGLLVGAGVALLTLFRTNKKFLENVKIVAILWVIGLAVGCLIKALGISFM
nr:arsenic efflux protein [Lachnospiraceae bacterium]